ncbi:hypothetical protein CWI82_01950 [Pseudidiomarina tainanensis]|uniref:Uncharacterized protein n=1 Tax=Pseudidiomarina tainanensis TaxID=502365 RepID=A0ACD2HIV5_9GAMM|nr:DUF6701 domain-containing protein [Pseudidiomarina tainanensis]RZQ56099.1 hypothetical protein CWI82_01950 [Pseudidiomarina tainanensis]
MGFIRACLVVFALTPLIAHANWSLPNDAINNVGDFASCSFDGGQTVTCNSAITLTTVDATLSLTQNLNLVINGTFTTADGITINPNNSYTLAIQLGNNNFLMSGDNAIINANIAAGNVTISGLETVINGDLTALGNISVLAGPTVNGDMTAGGSVSNSGLINGKLTVAGSFINNPGAVLSGRVDASGSVQNSGTVTSNIDALGSVANNSGATAGSINSSSPVVNNGTVLGYINAPSVSGTGTAPFTCSINSYVGPCPGAQDPEFDYCSEVTLLTTYGVVGSGGFTFGNGSEINGNPIDGTGNTPTPVGQVDTVDLDYPPLDPLVYPTFSGGPNLNISKKNDPEDIPAGTYGTINVAGGKNGNFLGGTYYIDQLIVGATGSGTGITLGAGDYFIREIIFNSGIYVNTTSAGPARLFIETSIGESNANQLELNSSGSAANFQIYLYEGATIMLGNGNMGGSKDTLNFNGTIYGPFPDNDISLGNNNTLQGSILTAGTIDVGTDTVFNYSPEVQAEVTASLGCAPVDAEVHHYRLLHPQVLVSCYSAAIEVIACADDTCSATYDDPVTITITSSDGDSVWQGGNLDATTGAEVNLLFSNGSGSSGLRNVNGGTATLALSNASPTAVEATQCYDSSGTVPTSCEVTFNTAGLIITDTDGMSPLPSTFAGVDLPAALRAVETNTTTGACEARLTGTHNVNLGMQCLNPSACQPSQTLTIDGQAIGLNAAGGTANTQTLALTFDATGRVDHDLLINYSDVGQIRLFASLPLTEAPSASNPALSDPDIELVGTSINDFVVKPHTLVTRALDSAGDLWTSTTNTGAGFTAAAAPFSMVVQSLNAAGNPTPNFGLETTSAGVQVQFHSMAYPSPADLDSNGSKLTLNNPFVLDPTYPGAKRTSGAIWKEVGTVNLTARLTADDYLGAGDAFSRPPSPIGRFYPDRFAVSAANVLNACSGFSYMGQNSIDVSYTVQALNRLGEVTKNYANTGGVLYNDTATVQMRAASLTPSDIVADEFYNRLDFLPQTTWLAGELSFASSAIAFNRRTDNAPDGPYPELQLGLQLIDPSIDGRNFAAADLTMLVQNDPLLTLPTVATPIGGLLELRYGRLRLENIFGPENEDLPIVMYSEYFDGNRFLLNELDSCTSVLAANLNIVENPDAIDTTAGQTTGPILLTNGELSYGDLFWLAPNAPNNFGEFVFEYQTDPWLRYEWGNDTVETNENPRATAGFGQYRGNDRVIFWMERQ